MMDGMLSITFEGRGIDRSERSERGEEDPGPSPGLKTCRFELDGESGQKCLAVEGVRRGEGRLYDRSDSGEARGFMSRHFLDLGVVPLLTISGVTPALSGVRLAVMRTELTFLKLIYNHFSPKNSLYNHFQVKTIITINKGARSWDYFITNFGGFKLL